MLTTHTRHAKEKMSCRSIPKHHLKMQITVIFHTASWQGRVCLHVQQCTHNPHPQHCWVPKHHKIPHSSIPHCPGTWHLTGLCPHPPTTPFLARAIPLGSFLPASSKFILTLQVHLDSPPFLVICSLALLFMILLTTIFYHLHNPGASTDANSRCSTHG